MSPGFLATGSLKGFHTVFIHTGFHTVYQVQMLDLPHSLGIILYHFPCFLNLPTVFLLSFTFPQFSSFPYRLRDSAAFQVLALHLQGLLPDSPTIFQILSNIFGSHIVNVLSLRLPGSPKVVYALLAFYVF